MDLKLTSRGCMGQRALDYDVIDLPANRNECKNMSTDPLLVKYGDKPTQEQLAAAYKNRELKSTKSQPEHSIHIPSQSFVDQLYADILTDNDARREVEYPNSLSKMGRTGSFHWPTQYNIQKPLQLQKINFFNSTKKHPKVELVYDSIYHPLYPNNPYKYMYNLHREDRRHAKHTGLDINGEEMKRGRPGLLPNSDYGRSYRNVYPDARHHIVHCHKSFYRNRGEDGTR